MWNGMYELEFSQRSFSTLFHLFNEYKVLLRHFSHTRQFFIDFKGLQPLCCHEKWVFLCLTKNNCAFFTEILFLQLSCLDKSKFQLLGRLAMKFYPVLTQKQFLHSTFWWKNGCYTSLFDSQGTNVLILSRGGEF